MRDVSAAEIEAPLHRKMSLVLDLLGDQLAEDDLLGEVLASDHNTLAMVAGGEANKCERDGGEKNRPR
jgi:hypothetical protein